ncbi:pollen-specific leucine-rich repeat extensin-like protein 3 [Helianthus annuus]|uniref:pollen-specific leucine-rich repeat extensin-like protein 3 n=1 Tax=Helianthus annuus TaxID=4232 RepID=UPI000B907176|nr:pollen-specific leucine-rich repeat extensin-like protein 3 [Helianthus annuus]
MPPRMRGRGRGQGAYVAPNDHEAGPSHRRTPSGSHNTDAQNLWRSFTEPARHSVSQGTSPSIPHSFGPQSENEPHNSHQSYIPLQGHQSPFDQPSPVFQGLFNPADYLDVPMGFNPLGPEDHFPGDNAMEVDEDTDPSMPPSGTPNHPIEISDGSPFVGSPYNGPDSFEVRFRQHDWVFTPSYHNSPLHQPQHSFPLHLPQLQQQPQQQQNPSEDSRLVAVTPPPPPPPVTFPPGYNFTEDPYWVAANYNSLNPESTFGGPWTTGQPTYGYPPYGYQQPQPPQPPHYPLPPPAPMMSPPQVQEILQGINDVRREMRHELREERRHNRGMFKKMVDLIKGKSKKDY